VLEQRGFSGTAQTGDQQQIAIFQEPFFDLQNIQIAAEKAVGRLRKRVTLRLTLIDVSLFLWA
jgi:hypothetical protein